MRIVAGIAVWIAALCLAATGEARAETLPDQRPMLRIEAGMHTAPIKSIGVDTACTLMVTGSDDKTARLWALPDGGRGALEPLRTLRMPIGEGDEGKVYAVALSPDGRWVAAGGYDARWSADQTMSVTIFEAVTGRLVTRLGRLGNVINHLTFSPDGSRLAATLGDGEGVRLWETGSWRLLAEDKNYDGKDSYGAAFDGANQLYTVAWDGPIRRYGADGRREVAAATLGGREPYSIAAHPNGAKLAVGFTDSTAVEVYDARTLKRLYAANTAGISDGELGKVAWSADGARLHAGGQHRSANGNLPVVIWQDEGRGRRREAPLAQDTIMQLLPCGSGIAVGAADPAFGVIAADSGKLIWQEGVAADVRDRNRQHPAIAQNGNIVRLAFDLAGTKRARFDLRTFRVTDENSDNDRLSGPKTSGISVGDWKDNEMPKLNGKLIALKAYETSRSLAIAPDRSRFVLGTEWSLRAYGADGRVLWQKPVPGVAWGVNISGDGRLVVAAYGDGTIRWHRMSDGQELLALFVHAKDRRFVAWTPKGYYAASPGAEELIGWHVNRDWDHAPDFFPAARFRDQFNRPDIVRRVLDDLDEDKAVAEANRIAGTRAATEVARRQPPIITILSPSGGGVFDGGPVTVRYSVRSPSGLAITEIAALADGRPIPGGAARGPSNASASETEGAITLASLPQRDLTLSLVARAGDLESTPESIPLTFRSATPPSTAALPSAAALPSQAGSLPTVSLYALVVGVGKFKNASINELARAAKDARDFAEALRAQQGRLYRKVDVKLLADEDADNGAILDGLSWLQRQVSQGDVGVVFLSGHGVTSPTGSYYYIPYNARFEDVAGVALPTRGSSVADIEIATTLKQLAGNALFFFDTCHAGKAAGISFKGEQDYNKLINEIAGSANAVVLASSTGAELSQERDDWKQGAFTKALLEGLSGAADVLPKDGVVTVDELNLYVKERVKELTGGLQHPVDLKPKEARNIPFAMAR